MRGADEALARILRAYRGADYGGVWEVSEYPTIRHIQTIVAAHFNVLPIDMVSKRRSSARARQVAMWIACQVTTHSQPEIGRSFGMLDHTTVGHAIRRVDELRATDEVFRQDVHAALLAVTGRPKLRRVA